ncbi:MAG: hypothetical protein P8Y07_03700 [Gemmatimonadales bacterium]
MRSEIKAARHPVLTTHINADGDGAGCEVALALYLERQGIKAAIVNPTPFPETFSFLLHHLTPWSCVMPRRARRAS